MAVSDTILDSFLPPADDAISDELARYLLSARLEDSVLEEYQQLAERNQFGTITADELKKLERFVDTNTVLSILQARARKALRSRGSAA